MTEFDCWFLDLAVESPVSFLMIMPYDQCIVADDYQTPSNLTTNQIVDILFRLFQDGFLLALTQADFYSLETSLMNNLLTKAFVPSRQQIRAALDRNNFKNKDSFNKTQLYFFLTKKGGDKWESRYKPKWNQYFRRCIHNWESVSEKFYNNSIPPRGSVISCVKREIGEKIIAVEHLLEYPQSIIYQYIEDSAIWEKFTPWHPTYWKTIPSGHVVSYQSKLIEINENHHESEELIEEKKQARRWYKDIRNWYINPRI